MRSLTLLLELLTVIPEEFQTLILSSNRRSVVRHTFAAGTDKQKYLLLKAELFLLILILSGLNQVLPFLLNVISHNSQHQEGQVEAVLQVSN